MSEKQKFGKWGNHEKGIIIIIIIRWLLQNRWYMASQPVSVKGTAWTLFFSDSETGAKSEA